MRLVPSLGIPAGLNKVFFATSQRPAAADRLPSEEKRRPVAPDFRIVVGSERGGALLPGLPVLAGEDVEKLFPSAQAAGTEGELRVYQSGTWRLGSIVVPVGASSELAALAAYRQLLRATAGLALARIWNYVPAINAAGAQGLENYRLFSRGRSIAFEEALGEGFKAQLPAASAVGCASDLLTVVFAATAEPVRHVENPLQLPAYDYPREHGPRAPSFARGTVVGGRDGVTVFISGTAAIRGHATVAPDQLSPQLDCALENLAEISAGCGLGRDLGRSSSARRFFKVYVRDPADLEVVRARLERHLLRSTDVVSYLHSAICRSALRVEIEATVMAS